MPFIFGMGYAGQRFATAASRACGGGEDAQRECRKVAARMTAVADPIGTLLGIAHEEARVASQCGSETGRKIDAAMSNAARLDQASSWMADGFKPKS